MNKKIRKPLSILLAVSMVSSMFVGTAVGASSGKTTPKALLEADQVLFVTEEGDQLSQKLDAANNVTISTASEALKASPSVASKIVADDGKSIMVIPEATASDATKITFSVASSSQAYSSEVTVKQNWFSKMLVTMDQLKVKGTSEELAKNSKYTDSGEVSVKIFDEEGTREVNTDAIVDAKIESDKLIVSGVKKGSATYLLKAMKSGTVVGLCELSVTVAPEDEGGGDNKPDTVNVFSKTVFDIDQIESELPLGTTAKALVESGEVILSIASGDAITLNGTKVTGVKKGTAKIVASLGENVTGKELTGTELTVNVSGMQKADLFVEHQLTVRAGAEEKVLNLASTSQALKAPSSDNDKLKLRYEKEQAKIFVRAEADFSGDKATVRIETESGEYFDICTVTVTPKDKHKANFFAEKSFSVTVGEEKAIEFTEDAKNKLRENDPEFAYDQSVITVSYHEDDVRIRGEVADETELTLTIGNEYDTCTVKVTKSYADELLNALGAVDNIDKDTVTIEEIADIVDDVKGILDKMLAEDPEQLNRLDNIDDIMNSIETLEDIVKEKFGVNPEKEINVEGVEEFEVIGLALNADLNNLGKKVKLVVAEGKKPSKGYSKNAVALKIDLFVGDNSQQPKVPLKVTMTAPIITDSNLIKVSHLKNGKLVGSYVTAIEDGKITICITSLSTFVFDVADADDEITDVVVTPPTPDPEQPSYNGGSSSRGGSGGGFSSNKAARNLYAMSGNWEQVGASWKFKKLNGYYAKNEWGYINNSYYYFGDDQLMKTGWQYISNAWYYLNPAVGSEEGKMLTGWQQINGSLYYLNTSGAMAADQYVDGYYVNASGARVQ